MPSPPPPPFRGDTPAAPAPQQGERSSPGFARRPCAPAPDPVSAFSGRGLTGTLAPLFVLGGAAPLRVFHPAGAGAFRLVRSP